MEYFDLSNAQERLLFTDPDNLNNSAFYVNFRKYYPLNDINYLMSAVNIISSTYLNLQITMNSNGVKQYYINEDLDSDKFEFFDLSGYDEDDVDDFIVDFLSNPFDSILDCPMYKWGILKTDTSAILVGVTQHILTDGTTLFTCIPREIDRCIELEKNNMQYEPINNLSYDVYVNREKEYLSSHESKIDKQYWLNSLKDYSQDWYSFNDFTLGTYEELLDNDLIKKLERLTNVNGIKISPFVLALSTTFLYLSRSKLNNKRLIILTTVDGRYFGEDIKDNLGMYVNTIPLIFDYDEEMTFDDLLLYVKSVLKSGLSHARLHLNVYSSDLDDMNLSSGCVEMYSIVSNSTRYECEFLSLEDQTDFPFHIRVNKNYNDDYGLQSLFYDYNVNCFSFKQIKEISSSLINILNQVAEDSSKSLKDYDIDVNEFFKAEKYFLSINNSFNQVTRIPRDVNKSNRKEIVSKKYNLSKDKLKLINEYIKDKDLTLRDILNSVILYNISNYSNSDNILISSIFSRNINGNEYLDNFNELLLAYKINKNDKIIDYIRDSALKIRELETYSFYPLKNLQTIDFKPEIVYNYVDNSKLDYNSIYEFNTAIYKELNINKYNLNLSVIENNNEVFFIVIHDKYYYSEELIDEFMESSFNLLELFLDTPKKYLKEIK